jgi:predicted small lipoprotein YifL
MLARAGVCVVNRRLDRPFRRLATAGALALALPLAACGLKGSLDPPPAEAPPPQVRLEGQPQSQPPAPGEQPQPARRRFFLDFLLD